MKKRYLYVALALFISMLIPAGCDGESGTSIAISSPAFGQTFSSGDTLRIQAKLTSATQDPLHGYEIHVRNSSDQTEVFQFEEHTHGVTIDIDQSWVIDVADATLEVEIVSVNDHNGSINRRKIEVRVN